MRLIDADALLKKLDDSIWYNVADFNEAWYAVDHAPTVEDVPVVTGTWKAVTDDGENYKRICTCCGKEAPFDELEGVYLIYPHCPWCGARMDGDGNG